MMIPILDEIIARRRQRALERAHRHGAPRAAQRAGARAAESRTRRSSPSSRTRSARRRSANDLGWAGDVKYHAGAGAAAARRRRDRVDAAEPESPRVREPGRRRAWRAPPARRPIAPAPAASIRAHRLPILIHGDAAFPGQGIVAETLNLARLAGYDVGGTIHVIANNQIGFTATSRSSYGTSYASGLARGFKIPIIHVNADDPTPCIEAARLAAAYRAQFKRDILIDLIGYRRHGHNEGDEPSFTQPLIYQTVAAHPTVREIWAERLVERAAT